MLIALDARTIYRPQRRGTGKNLIDLYRHALALRPDWRVLALHRPSGLGAAEAAELLPPSARPVCMEMPGDRIQAWERFRLPWAAWRGGADVLHCPANTSPGWMPAPTVVTIHDLIPLDLAEERPAEEVRRFEQAVRQAVRQAAGLICPSQYTAGRLVREFGADPERLTVNPWAADSAVRRVPAEQWGTVLSRYGVEQPFVLHFGAAAPRKNTKRVLAAWAMLEGPLRRAWQLLVVGLDDPARAEMGQCAARLGITASVSLRGFAEESDLPVLLSAAGLVAYPSLSEGFGLPVLDAWAAGTPVLTSNSTSLPEVAGDAALLVDPADGVAIARGLARLMKDYRLRQDLVERGQRRLAGYTWEAAAERFVGALEKAVAVARGQGRRAA